jgi:hypothetical protein
LSDDAPPKLVRARWTGVFLVCEDCRSRGSGPKDKPKAVASAVRQESRRSGERARIVLTGCLGLCPKKATAVAHAGSASPASMVAVRSLKHLREAVAALSARSVPD